MIQILIAVSHGLFAEALALALAKQEGFEVAGTADESGALLARLRERVPDVLILGQDLRGTPPRELLAGLPGAMSPGKIIYIGNVSGMDQSGRGQRRIGGFLSKECPLAELVHAVTEVHQGKQYFSMGADNRPVAGPLTEKEQRVLRLICRGQRAGEIASALSLSVPVVEVHRKRLREKFGAKTDVGLALAAFKQGIVQ